MRPFTQNLGHAHEWSDYLERHIGGDFLLIYQVLENRISFVRAGTHYELFS